LPPPKPFSAADLFTGPKPITASLGFPRFAAGPSRACSGAIPRRRGEKIERNS